MASVALLRHQPGRWEQGQGNISFLNTNGDELFLRCSNHGLASGGIQSKEALVLVNKKIP